MSQPGTSAVWLYAGVFAVIFLLEFLRRPGGLLYPTLYFEDGLVFYRDQLVSASISTLFQPFTFGYYILAPRLVAFLAYSIPARGVPYLFNITGLGIGAASTAVFCLPVFRRILESDAMRVALCILWAVAMDSTEFLATPSNCFWLIGIPVILLAVLPPSVPSGAPVWRHCAFVLAGALLGLLTPLALIVAPIAAWQIYRNRRSSRWQLPAGYLLATVIQMSIYLTSAAHAGQPGFPALITALLVVSAHRVVMSSILGLRLSVSLMNQRASWAPLLGLALLEAVALCLLFRGGRLTRVKTALCLYILGGNLLLSLTGKGTVSQFQQIAGDVSYGGPRYFYISACAFALLVALAIEQEASGFFRNLRAGWARHARAKQLAMLLVLVAAFLTPLITNFRCENGTDFHWATYSPLIDSWKQAVARGLPVAAAIVPINLPGWSIILPGSRVANGGFEEETLAPWTSLAGSNATASTVQPHNGRKSLLVEGKGGVFTDLWTAQPGRKYIVTAWVRSDCDKPASGGFWIHDGAAHQAFIDKGIGCAWEPISLEFTSTSTHSMRIHLANNSLGLLYWDDVMVTSRQ